MTRDDAEQTLRLAETVFEDLDARLGRPPEPGYPTEAGLVRFGHPVDTDPGGCWVAEQDGRLVGAVQAIDREGIWGLSVLVVDPGVQSQGIGRALLDRALAYAGGGRRGGIIVSSQDPRAIRRYARAGFAIEPALEAAGPVRRRPERPARVRPGDAGDFADIDAIGRAVRGAGHGPDLQPMLDTGAALLVVPGEGAVLHREGDLGMLVARDCEVAADLLRAVLAEATAPHVGCITGRQQWALRVALDAGLEVQFGGAVCTRGDVGPFSPYLPSGAYL